MSGNILFLSNKIFEIPPFFQTRLGDLGKKVHACSLRFSAFKLRPGSHAMLGASLDLPSFDYSSFIVSRIKLFQIISVQAPL